MTIDRRTVLLGGSALSLTALSACRATDEDEPAGSSPGRPSASASETGALPVSIPHKFGSTKITEPARRVVCVGYVEQDMLLALGIVPVGVSEWLKGADDEIYPWAMPKLGRRPAPQVLPTADGVAVEKVAALRPDLIVANYQGLSAADYQRLSKLAPTVAQPKEYLDWGVPWDVNALRVAQAVGKPEEGKRIVADVRKQIADAKKDHPEFAGKSTVVLSAWQGVYLYGPQDPRTRLMTDLGFVFPDKFTSIGGGKEFGGQVSPERSRELDYDAVVWVSSEAESAKGTGGLWKQTKAQREGRSIYISSNAEKGTPQATYSSAFSFLTPLSIPYLLKSLVPQLAAAVDGDPQTKIPAPKAYGK